MMHKLLLPFITCAHFCSVSSRKLRGSQAFVSRSTSRSQQEDVIPHVDKRQLLENIDSYLYNVDQYKAQYDHQDIGMLDMINMMQAPANKVELDVYDLTEDYTSDDYMGQLEGLLPTPTKYHNEHFFLSMDVREHRYEEVTLDTFGYVHNNAYLQTEPTIDDNDLVYRQDTRSIVGLLGLLPGNHPLSTIESEITESKSPQSSNAMFDILEKTDTTPNIYDSEAYEGLPTKMYHWVGMLHGLLPGGTVYHNDEFFLPFASIEHKYDSVPHSFVEVVDLIKDGDRNSAEVYQPLVVEGADGKVIYGLLGLLPGASKRTDPFITGDVFQEAIELQQLSVTPTMLNMLEAISYDDKVNPQVYESPYTILNDGDYVGQLHGILPDHNNKMKYIKYKWDELVDSEIEESNGISIHILNLKTESKTTGVLMDAPESGHDVTDALRTDQPTTAPTFSPSAFPSATMSPSTVHESYIVAQVDFANIDARRNSNFVLNNGAQILPAPGVVSNALRIDRDGPYATIPGINIGPSEMPECTLMIGLYVERIANGFGWVFGHEEGGYDRTILIHDNRFGGGIASAIGYPWSPWMKPHIPTKQWIHVTAVFRQGGESYVFLNGVKSDNSAIGKNDEGLGDLWIGRPRWGGHWTDSWIKEVKVFNTALDDSIIETYAEDFLTEVTHVPVVCGSSYGNCDVKTQLSNTNTSEHAVRCCSDFIRPGWEQNPGCGVWAESELNGLCYERVTFASAIDICTSQGARLCTQSELERDCAAGSGCELDHHMIWSSPLSTGVESTS